MTRGAGEDGEEAFSEGPAFDVAPVAKDTRFRRFALAKTAQMTAQNALIYGLFIAFITEQSTYLAGSAFVLAAVLPSVFLSVPGGLIADRLPNKLVLVVVLAIRCAIVWQFLDASLSLESVVLLTFLVFTAYQFFTPAENEAVVAVTSPEKTAAALALLQALSLLGQILGAGVIAPFSIDLLGEDGLFLIVLGLFVASAALYFSVAELTPKRQIETYRLGWWSALPAGYRAIRADSTLMQVTVLRVLTDTSLLMVMVAAPKYIEDTLGSSPDKAVYIGSPAAIGLALGLIVTAPLARRLSTRILTLTGFMLFVAVLACLPFIGRIDGPLLALLPWWDRARSTAGLSSQIAAVIVLLPLAGLGISLVQVASRATVYQRVQPGLIGQVLATQSALGSLTAVAPTFLAGALLDVLPVTVFLTGVVIAVLAFASMATTASDRIATAPPPEGQLLEH